MTRTGSEKRASGIYRGYRYDTPVPAPEPSYVRLLIIGYDADGHGLGLDEDGDGRIYSIVPAGRLSGIALAGTGDRK